MQFGNVFTIVTSITHVVQVRQAAATSECSSIKSSIQATLMPKMPSDLASAEAIVETDICHYVRPPIQTALVSNLHSKYLSWMTEVQEWQSTSSNKAVMSSLDSRCHAYLQSSAESSNSALMSCADEFATKATNGSVVTTIDGSVVVMDTLSAKTGSSVTPAGAATPTPSTAGAVTPTPSTPGAGHRSGVSIVLAAGAVLVVSLFGM